VTSPNNSTTKNHALNDVSCASSSDCTAVGYYVSASNVFQTLIEKWNGTAWSIATSQNSNTAQSNLLFAVTCTATNNCFAVGSFFNGNGVEQTLIEKWNGTAWSISSSPNMGTALTNRLQGVACSAATDCWAVGYTNNTFDQTLTERWNGTVWSMSASTNMGIANSSASNSLAAVTCVSTNDCWAAGNFDGGTPQVLTMHWNGINWSIISSPNTDPGQPNFLAGIDCTSSSNCWAAGMYDNGTADQNLIEHWDGTSWTIVSSPNTAAGQSNMLNGLTCTSASQCFAVGFYTNASNVNQTLILQWNGASWSIVPSPNVGSGQANQLNAVTCSGANDCWAVGTAELGAFHQTLVERWNGSSWTIVTSPNLSTMLDNFLTSVACSSSSDCWAVGNFFFNNIAQPLIERWDGTSWGIVPSQNTSGTDNDFLDGVACSAPGDCSAVGSAVSAASLGFIQQWNGDAWKLLNAPAVPNTDQNALSAVTCLNGSDCWIVGMSDVSGTMQTVIEKRTVPVLSLNSITLGAVGHTILSGKAVANSTVSVYAASNLANRFTLLGSATADASGNFTYDDASGATRLFYRIHYP
jgi:hypothetical protein